MRLIGATGCDSVGSPGTDREDPPAGRAPVRVPASVAGGAAGATGRCGWFCFCGASGTSGRADGLGAVTGLEAAPF